MTNYNANWPLTQSDLDICFPTNGPHTASTLSLKPRLTPEPARPQRPNIVTDVKMMPPTIVDYFPQAKGDGLNILWEHAVNSKSRLAGALRGPGMILEGDVSMGANGRYPVPVMAHPPAIASDITLEEWLHEILMCGTKGVKLDFKSTEVVEPACRILARFVDKFRGPVILNADVLPGPDCCTAPPVDAWTFLTLCRTRFPRATISIGWTTDDTSCIKMGYTREMTESMGALVREYNLGQPVTFPVWLPLVRHALGDLQRLLAQVPRSSLTVFARGPCRPSVLPDLATLRTAFSPGLIYYDLPHDLLRAFLPIS